MTPASFYKMTEGNVCHSGEPAKIDVKRLFFHCPVQIWINEAVPEEIIIISTPPISAMRFSRIVIAEESEISACLENVGFGSLVLSSSTRSTRLA
jgi:hypothetical protein